MKLGVIGAGYVGLITAVCFAEVGNEIICVDNNDDKVKMLSNGISPIFEIGLEQLMYKNKSRITFTTNLNLIDDCKIVFLCLPTPPLADGSADLRAILEVAESISKIIKEYTVIVNKSTVPVGTAEKVKSIFSKELNLDLVDVVSNPEFLREGSAIEDFMKPDRVVIGSSDYTAIELMKSLYEPFVRQGNPIIVMDEKSAELTKYAANAYLATRISFINEIANMCEVTGANVDNVRTGMATDSRIGKQFLYPGIGYGGSCFPKDVRALLHTSLYYGYDPKILSSVIEVNAKQYKVLTDKILTYFNGSYNKNITVWGLAFKANTDDIRESPSLKVIDFLLSLGFEITVYDPEAMENVKKIYGDKLKYAKDLYSALKDSEALLILTEWSVFKSPNFEVMKSVMKKVVIFDGRNLYKKSFLPSYVRYESIGRNNG